MAKRLMVNAKIVEKELVSEEEVLDNFGSLDAELHLDNYDITIEVLIEDAEESE